MHMVKRMITLAVVLMSAQASEAAIYRWIDSKGVTNYSSTPPAVPKLQEIKPVINTPAVTQREVSDDSYDNDADDAQDRASKSEGANRRPVYAAPPNPTCVTAWSSFVRLAGTPTSQEKTIRRATNRVWQQ